MKKLIKIILLSLGIVLLLIALIIALININDESQNVCTLIGCSETVSIQVPNDVLNNISGKRTVFEFGEGNTLLFNVSNIEENSLVFEINSRTKYPILPVQVDYLKELSEIKISTVDLSTEFILSNRGFNEEFFYPNEEECGSCINTIFYFE